MGRGKRRTVPPGSCGGAAFERANRQSCSWAPGSNGGRHPGGGDDPVLGACLRLQRGGGVRGWGRDGLGTGRRGGGARARRALMLPWRSDTWQRSSRLGPAAPLAPDQRAVGDREGDRQRDSRCHHSLRLTTRLAASPRARPARPSANPDPRIWRRRRGDRGRSSAAPSPWKRLEGRGNGAEPSSSFFGLAPIVSSAVDPSRVYV
jgi:hypothetical protein